MSANERAHSGIAIIAARHGGGHYLCGPANVGRDSPLKAAGDVELVFAPRGHVAIRFAHGNHRRREEVPVETGDVVRAMFYGLGSDGREQNSWKITGDTGRYIPGLTLFTT
jgi:hypothetical protein